MIWIPAGAWIAAAVVAVVVLGFCGYEIAWKSRRLQRDVAQLQRSAAELTDVLGRLSATGQQMAQRLSTSGGR